eukprot:TRINITY_DN9189_c0_g1_i1.p1 TRINITY_DN9189_c0_g1~~TRINITY_DN9189_c0_g1_i1.p1  ORF type:complete len:176 (+),score=25.14 TRINITY_DN9189_c0_g1_i1:433-960(+)
MKAYWRRSKLGPNLKALRVLNMARHKLKRPMTIEEVRQVVARYHITMDVGTFNFLLEKCGTDTDKALCLWEEMQRLKVAPNTLTIEALIQRLAGQGRHVEALKIVKQMSSQFHLAVTPMMATYMKIACTNASKNLIREARGAARFEFKAKNSAKPETVFAEFLALCTAATTSTTL